MNRKIKIFLRWLSVAGWLAVIFYFSNQPNLASSLSYWWDLLFRKIAHIAEYFVLAYLFFKAFFVHGLNYKKNLVLSSIFTVLTAIFDEWHQLYTQGRIGSIIDVGIDCLGVVIILVLFYINRKIYFHEDLPDK